MKQLFKITLRNDYAFKRVFGVEENKDVLQDLLECILDILPETIAGLELLDKEVHKDSISDKTGVLDVKLRLKNNTVRYRNSKQVEQRVYPTNHLLLG